MHHFETIIPDHINQAIFKIWKDCKISNLVPQFYGSLNPNSLLVVGLNPSFSIKGFRSFLKGSKYDQHLADLKSFYSFSRISENLNEGAFDLFIQDFIEIENISKAKYSYYIKIQELVKETNLKWEHIDLFFVRDTKQKELEELYKERNECLKKQIELSKQLIKLLKPKMIVVANAFASKIMLEHYDLTWNKAIGTFKLTDETPVFLCSMLTGQRALDKGSFDRLKWHLNFVVTRMEGQHTTGGFVQ